MKKKLIILVGMSGSGKTTTLRHLTKNYTMNIIPQWTTRPKRKFEENESDYLFATKENSPFVKDMLTHYATKTVYGIWHYGFSRQQFEDNPNKINILVTELDSALKLKSALKGQYDTHIIFLNPPIKDIRKRLEKRGDNPEEVRRRLLADAEDFQYAHLLTDYEVNTSEMNITKLLIDDYLKVSGVL